MPKFQIEVRSSIPKNDGGNFFSKLIKRFRLPVNSSQNGFTLIELLIVIAIILILIAIALPNFLEAQIRAKATKARADLRGIGQALEAYYLDFHYYPGESESTWAEHTAITEDGLKRITTPIAYIAEIPEDPFPAHHQASYGPGELRKYYGGGCTTNDLPAAVANAGPIYLTWSRGPSQNGAIPATHVNVDPYGGEIVSYSPTNGTKSGGTIHHFHGEGAWWGLKTGGNGGNYCYRHKLKMPELRVGLMVDKIVYIGQRPPNAFQ
ncbi:MAG: prepilin-type N-terminal cleavage/methylation domain-containing protein [Candidatus Omnitrophica bacterium]|nr:prepilin-type N-terminal cleavage/methylation domain-containing protein [Candidatus Omnitrophota bacterium]